LSYQRSDRTTRRSTTTVSPGLGCPITFIPE
jgi:hypothetical protein